MSPEAPNTSETTFTVVVFTGQPDLNLSRLRAPTTPAVSVSPAKVGGSVNGVFDGASPFIGVARCGPGKTILDSPAIASLI